MLARVFSRPPESTECGHGEQPLLSARTVSLTGVRRISLCCSVSAAGLGRSSEPRTHADEAVRGSFDCDAVNPTWFPLSRAEYHPSSSLSRCLPVIFFVIADVHFLRTLSEACSQVHQPRGLLLGDTNWRTCRAPPNLLIEGGLALGYAARDILSELLARGRFAPNPQPPPSPSARPVIPGSLEFAMAPHTPCPAGSSAASLPSATGIPLRVIRAPVASLQPDPSNVRLHGPANLDAIKASLMRFGQAEPLIVQTGTRRVIAGHGRLDAMKALGWAECDIVELDVGGVYAAALGIALNRTAELAEWDSAALAKILDQLRAEDSLDGVGYSADDIDALLDELRDNSPRDVDDPGPDAPPIKPVSRTGDLWHFGDHRLLCGDARLRDDLRALLDGERAACMWTDPPYGVSYVGKTADALTIENDGAEGLAALLSEAFAAADDVALQPGARLYVAHPAGALSVTFGVAFLATGWRLHETLVWVKDCMVLGHSDYHYQHEPILYGFKPGPAGSGRWGRGGAGWYGDNSQTSVFHVDRPKRSELHPTMKPIELIVRCLQNSTAPDDIVLEPFCGSGSQLIAAETLRRRCRAMEISPAFVDVAIRRWEGATGKRATLDGKTYEQVAAERGVPIEATVGAPS